MHFKHINLQKGMIEYYLSLILFVTMSALLAVISQRQIKKIQLEKVSWLAQDQTWSLTSQDQKVQNHLASIESSISSSLQSGDKLSWTDPHEKNGLNLDKKNIIRLAWDLYQVTKDYYQCGDLHEPATFLMMKKALYRHKNKKLFMTFDQNISGMDWIQNFLGPEITTSNTLETDYTMINRAFTGDDFLSSTGWKNRQLLWQEALHHTDRYNAFIPLQLIGTYELVQFGQGVAGLSAPWPLKKPVENGAKAISKKLFNDEEVAMFLDTFVFGQETDHRPTYNNKKCNELKGI